MSIKTISARTRANSNGFNCSVQYNFVLLGWPNRVTPYYVALRYWRRWTIRIILVFVEFYFSHPNNRRNANTAVRFAQFDPIYIYTRLLLSWRRQRSLDPSKSVIAMTQNYIKRYVRKYARIVKRFLFYFFFQDASAS